MNEEIYKKWMPCKEYALGYDLLNTEFAYGNLLVRLIHPDDEKQPDITIKYNWFKEFKISDESARLDDLGRLSQKHGDAYNKWNAYIVENSDYYNAVSKNALGIMYKEIKHYHLLCANGYILDIIGVPAEITVSTIKVL